MGRILNFLEYARFTNPSLKMTFNFLKILALVSAGMHLQGACGQCAIVHVVPSVPVVVSDSTAFGRNVHWDVDLNGGVDYEFFNNGITFGVIALEFNRFVSNGSDALAFQLGASVGGSLNVGEWTMKKQGVYACASGDNGSFCVGEFIDGGIMAIEFRINGGIHYGWVRIESMTPFVGGTLTEWAYESEAGEPILAGAIPEPSTGALVIVAGVAAVLRRRRRAEGKTEPYVVSHSK